MADGLTTEVLQEGFSRIAEKLDQAAGELNTLDGHLGDGDLGVAMQRAARSIREILPTLSQDLGMALLRCAQALVKVSGSSYGTLISTGLMSAAKATRGKTQVSWGQISNLLSGAIEAMAQRGKSQLGQKTVLDAIEAARLAVNGLEDPGSIVKAADQGVARALEEFRGKTSQIGRARIWAEESVGRDDPGMVAFKRMVEALRT